MLRRALLIARTSSLAADRRGPRSHGEQLSTGFTCPSRFDGGEICRQLRNLLSGPPPARTGRGPHRAGRTPSGANRPGAGRGNAALHPSDLVGCCGRCAPQSAQVKSAGEVCLAAGGGGMRVRVAERVSRGLSATPMPPSASARRRRLKKAHQLADPAVAMLGVAKRRVKAEADTGLRSLRLEEPRRGGEARALVVRGAALRRGRVLPLRARDRPGRAAGPAGGTPAAGPRLDDRVGAPGGCVARPRSGGSPSASCGRAAARARGALLPRGGGLRSGGHVDGDRARLTLDRAGGARGPIALRDGDADRAR
jgi:hypothetical protein